MSDHPSGLAAFFSELRHRRVFPSHRRVFQVAAVARYGEQ